MACVYRKPILKTVDGKRVPVVDEKGREVFRPYWYARIVKHDGKRREIKIAATTEADAKKQAARLEAQQIDIKAGLRPAPTSADRAGVRSFDDVSKEFLDAGNLNGGRGGRPWSKHNAKKRKYYIEWWKKELSLDNLNDLKDCLSRAESALKKLKEAKKSNKTLALYREGIFVFAAWCEERGYLEKNPIARLSRFSNLSDPKNRRRDMTPEEIKKLLESVPLYRRMLYEAAFATGFRAGELRSLQPENLLMDRGCIYLSAEVDKARKERFQPVTASILQRLAEYAKTGEALKTYKAKFFAARRPLSAAGIPANPLLYVPRQPSETIQADLVAAGIPIRTEEGKLDFHACRVAYINFVIRAAKDIKTAQALARHSTPDLTFNGYGRENRSSMDVAAGMVCDFLTSLDSRKTDSNGSESDLSGKAVCHSSATLKMKDDVFPFEQRGYVDGLSHSNPPLPTILV